MVGKALLFVHRRFFRRGRNARRGDLVVDAPPDILSPGLAAIRPPGIGLAGGFRIEVAVGVDVADLLENLRHPGALLRQEAGIFLVAFPVLEVDFLVRDVPITTDHDFAPAGLERLQVRHEVIHETEFGVLDKISEEKPFTAKDTKVRKGKQKQGHCFACLCVLRGEAF
jgi:hypothetical protein